MKEPRQCEPTEPLIGQQHRRRSAVISRKSITVAAYGDVRDLQRIDYANVAVVVVETGDRRVREIKFTRLEKLLFRRGETLLANRDKRCSQTFNPYRLCEAGAADPVIIDRNELEIGWTPFVAGAQPRHVIDAAR